jgi:hypothetical protein
LFRCDFALLDLPLESQHFKKGRIQTILCMHLKKGWIVKVEHLILLLKLLFVLLLISLKAGPLLLGGIHVTNKSLNLGCRQILILDATKSSRYFCRS